MESDKIGNRACPDRLLDTTVVCVNKKNVDFLKTGIATDILGDEGECRSL